MHKDITFNWFDSSKQHTTVMENENALMLIFMRVMGSITLLNPLIWGKLGHTILFNVQSFIEGSDANDVNNIQDAWKAVTIFFFHS